MASRPTALQVLEDWETHARTRSELLRGVAVAAVAQVQAAWLHQFQLQAMADQGGRRRLQVQQRPMPQVAVAHTASASDQIASAGRSMAAPAVRATLAAEVAGLRTVPDQQREMACPIQVVAVAVALFAMEPITAAVMAQLELWSFAGLPTQQSPR
jgi:hypothetical protein